MVARNWYEMCFFDHRRTAEHIRRYPRNLRKYRFPLVVHATDRCPPGIADADVPVLDGPVVGRVAASMGQALAADRKVVSFVPLPFLGVWV